MKETIYPQRSLSHRIDSLAMRFIRTQLPTHWIDRDLSERDYGIDLAIEIFNKEVKSTESESSTGLLSLIQVKGTAKPLEGQGEYYKFPKFPVKTLNYAQQFKIPFFLIVVFVDINSLQKSSAYFLWLQDYVRKEGYGLLKEKWRQQETITLYIPKENNFIAKQDFFRKCVEKDHSEMVKIDIIRQFSLVNDYTRNLANANIVEVMSMWLKLLDSIEQFCPSKISYFDIVEIRKICSAVKKNPNSLNKQIGQFQQYIKKIKIIITKLFDLSELDEAPPINDLPRQYNGKQISKIALALIKNGKFI